MSLKKNTLWNIVGAGAPFLLGLITIPFLIKETNVEIFGILSLVWALIGYFSIFDFGLGRALTQQIASLREKKQTEELASCAKTGFVFTFYAGVAGGIVLCTLAFPLGFYWLHVSTSLQLETSKAIAIASIGIPFTTMTTGLKGIMEAHEDFKTANVLRIFLGLANFGLPALSVIVFGPSLPCMVTGLIIARFAVLVGHYHQVNKMLPNEWNQVKYNQEKMRKLLAFGSWMTLSNIVSPLMVVADRFIISSLVGASVVAYYTVPADMLIRVLIIPAAISTALFPRLSALMVANKKEAKRLYYRSLKITFIVMFPMCMAIAVASKFGLNLWLGEEFANNSWKIAAILALGIMLNGIAQVPHASVQASANAKGTAILHAVEFVLYLPLLFIAIKYYGLIGAAIVWVLRVILDLIALLIMAKRTHDRTLA